MKEPTTKYFPDDDNLFSRGNCLILILMILFVAACFIGALYIAIYTIT